MHAEQSASSPRFTVRNCEDTALQYLWEHYTYSIDHLLILFNIWVGLSNWQSMKSCTYTLRLVLYKYCPIRMRIVSSVSLQVKYHSHRRQWSHRERSGQRVQVEIPNQYSLLINHNRRPMDQYYATIHCVVAYNVQCYHTAST